MKEQDIYLALRLVQNIYIRYTLIFSFYFARTRRTGSRRLQRLPADVVGIAVAEAFVGISEAAASAASGAAASAASGAAASAASGAAASAASEAAAFAASGAAAFAASGAAASAEIVQEQRYR